MGYASLGREPGGFWEEVNEVAINFFLIILSDGIATLLVGLFLPPAIGLVGFIFGVYIYYKTYAVPSRTVLWSELRLYLVALAGMSLGSLMLWLACSYSNRPVCLPNNLKAQIFGSFAFPTIFLLITWFFIKLPALINGKK